MKIKRLILLGMICMVLFPSCSSVNAPIVATQINVKPSVTRVTESPVSATFTYPTPPLITLTPLPTLSVEEARQRVYDLLHSNAGCHLPCWWGIMPGETSWNDAFHSLSPFVSRIERGVSGPTSGNYAIEYEIDGLSETGRATISVHNGIVAGVSVSSTGNEISYQLHQLLSSFGPPGEIYVQATAHSAGDSSLLLFHLFIYYPNISVLAHYRYEGKLIGNIVQACPNSSGPELLLWEPGKNIVWDSGEEKSILSIISIGFDNFPPKNLGDATNFTIDEFYNIYREPGYQSCITTPANLWP
jgi:hypothetical protein